MFSEYVICSFAYCIVLDLQLLQIHISYEVYYMHSYK
jgi:hypothetical protein